jgi:hypothetical protein
VPTATLSRTISGIVQREETASRPEKCLLGLWKHTTMLKRKVSKTDSRGKTPAEIGSKARSAFEPISLPRFALPHALHDPPSIINPFSDHHGLSIQTLKREPKPSHPPTEFHFFTETMRDDEAPQLFRRGRILWQGDVGRLSNARSSVTPDSRNRTKHFINDHSHFMVQRDDM